MGKSRPKPNPDDRSDNVEKLQDAVDDTIGNLEASQSTLQNADLSEEELKGITEKNERRKESIEGMRAEIKDETRNQEENQR